MIHHGFQGLVLNRIPITVTATGPGGVVHEFTTSRKKMAVGMQLLATDFSVSDTPIDSEENMTITEVLPTPQATLIPTLMIGGFGMKGLGSGRCRLQGLPHESRVLRPWRNSVLQNIDTDITRKTSAYWLGRW